MRQGRTDQGGAGGRCRHARHQLDLDPGVRRPSLLEQQLEQRAGHPEYAHVAGRHQGDDPSRLRQRHGLAATVQLLGHLARDDLLVLHQVGDQPDIGPIADDHLGRRDGRARPARHLGDVAGAQAYG
jgi:hypothetical protein